MRPHLPWLGQGDIFRAVPVIVVRLVGAGNVEAEATTGPAVLLTHDCAMDKPDKVTGSPRVERLQFARLRSIDALPPDQRRSLRQGAHKDGPFDILYLDGVGEFGECFFLLNDPFYLPAAYFRLLLTTHPEHVEAESPEAHYTTPRANDTRFGRIDEPQLVLMRRKMVAYWTRFKPDGLI